MTGILKKALAALLLLSLVFSLFACHGKLDTSANGTENSATDYSDALLDFKLPENFDET